MAWKPNIFSCFKLVSSQHPDLDVSRLKVSYSFRNVILESILYCSRTKENKIFLKVIVDLFQPLISVQNITFCLLDKLEKVLELILMDDFHSKEQGS
jgi:hypothetical protein